MSPTTTNIHLFTVFRNGPLQATNYPLSEKIIIMIGATAYSLSFLFIFRWTRRSETERSETSKKSFEVSWGSLLTLLKLAMARPMMAIRRESFLKIIRYCIFDYFDSFSYILLIVNSHMPCRSQ